MSKQTFRTRVLHLMMSGKIQKGILFINQTILTLGSFIQINFKQVNFFEIKADLNSLIVETIYPVIIVNLIITTFIPVIACIVK